MADAAHMSVSLEHEGSNLKIKAGMLDLEYEIDGEPLHTQYMGFDFMDHCGWHTDRVSLCQTKVYKDGSKVTTIRTLSEDRQLLTYSNLWVDKDGGNAVRSTQVLARVGEVSCATGLAPSAGTGSGGDASAAAAGQAHSAASSVLKTLDDFVAGYETPPDGYATPPEFFGDNLNADSLLQQLTLTKEGLDADATEHAAGEGADSDEGAGGDSATDDVLLKWMWGDAALGGVSALARLAQANPLRWSASMSPADLQVCLRNQAKSRPVLVQILGQPQRIRFPNPGACVDWIKESMSELGTEPSVEKDVEVANPVQSVPGPAASPVKMDAEAAIWRFVSPVFMVYFMRRHARTTWREKNVFVASAYARRACQRPHHVSAMQDSSGRVGEGGVHARRPATLEDFQAAGGPVYKALVEAGSPFAFSQRPQQLEAGGKLWVCVDSSPYWMGWVAQSATGDAECVVCFRGADGRTLDSCQHPGSPVRAFINGCSENDLPDLPLELLSSLADRVAHVRARGGAGSVTLAGFSQGALVALACALGWGEVAGMEHLDASTLTAVHLFNCSTMFWPAWYQHLLAKEWWTVPPPCSAKISSWVIQHDPLSGEYVHVKNFAHCEHRCNAKLRRPVNLDTDSPACQMSFLEREGCARRKLRARRWFSPQNTEKRNSSTTTASQTLRVRHCIDAIEVVL